MYNLVKVVVWATWFYPVWYVSWVSFDATRVTETKGRCVTERDDVFLGHMYMYMYMARHGENMARTTQYRWYDS